MKKHFVWHIILFLATFLLFSLVVMLLWNAIFPQIFDVSEINFLQSAGILILSRMLFSGIGDFGGKFFHNNTHFRKNAMHEKWLNMNEKEREEFQKFHRNFRDFHGKHFREKHFDWQNQKNMNDETNDKNE